MVMGGQAEVAEVRRLGDIVAVDVAVAQAQGMMRRLKKWVTRCNSIIVSQEQKISSMSSSVINTMVMNGNYLETNIENTRVLMLRWTAGVWEAGAPANRVRHAQPLQDTTQTDKTIHKHKAQEKNTTIVHNHHRIYQFDPVKSKNAPTQNDQMNFLHPMSPQKQWSTFFLTNYKTPNSIWIWLSVLPKTGNHICVQLKCLRQCLCFKCLLTCRMLDPLCPCSSSDPIRSFLFYWTEWYRSVYSFIVLLDEHFSSLWAMEQTSKSDNIHLLHFQVYIYV